MCHCLPHKLKLYDFTEFKFSCTCDSLMDLFYKNDQSSHLWFTTRAVGVIQCESTSDECWLSLHIVCSSNTMEECMVYTFLMWHVEDWVWCIDHCASAKSIKDHSKSKIRTCQEGLELSLLQYLFFLWLTVCVGRKKAWNHSTVN